jgi:ABC-type xylose transport system substrate-binding protein
MYKPSKLIAEKTVELVVVLSNGEDTQYLITT